ncbi:MAG TPA: FAD-binding protein, partial [Epsilonproteobacteria bacterium]|nr:FAD-binding protein [Campylobacterota bacterium]
MHKKNIDIIGAGIAGLTTAIALRQKGFEVRIFEQTEELKHVGAGIILANNAMQIYENLGCRKAIEAKGNTVSSMCITQEKLDVISCMNLKYFESLYHVKTIAIHRGDLQDILRDMLKDVKIYFGYKLTNIKSHGIKTILVFENGISEESAMLIGADGLHSNVRQHLFPTSSLRYAKQVCWRGVAKFDLPLNYEGVLYEAWGNSARFGFVQISKSEVYWYALKSFENTIDEFSVNKIDKYFSDFHPIVDEIFSSTDKNTIHSSEIIDLNPMYTWHHDTICLLGDAAHAMTPNMGQGACQAIEDAYVLADCISQYSTQQAFAEYQKLRHAKVTKIVKTSWMVGKISHIQNTLGIKVRNFILSHTPSSLSRKQSKEIFDIHLSPTP